MGGLRSSRRLSEDGVGVLRRSGSWSRRRWNREPVFRQLPEKPGFIQVNSLAGGGRCARRHRFYAGADCPRGSVNWWSCRPWDDRDRVRGWSTDADLWRGGCCDADGGGCGADTGTPAMIPIASGVKVWIATGHTDMRRGMNSLALLVQEAFKRDPHGGDLYVFRGRSGSLIKILWHDGLGMSLYAKRLERGRFIWPQATDGVISISMSQLAYMLDGIDWRNPVHSWRPSAAG